MIVGHMHVRQTHVAPLMLSEDLRVIMSVVYLGGFVTRSLALRYLSISKVKMRFNWNLVKGRHLLFDDSSPYDS